jgi:HEAT repeat protein
MTVLDDPDPTVLETAAWACGEHEVVSDDVLERLITLAGDHDDALVREAAVAALGAIGDPRGLDAILAGCSDRPAVRRRAVLALAPFDGPDVDAALARALEDRDWQVRQAAEDLTSPTR